MQAGGKPLPSFSKLQQMVATNREKACIDYSLGYRKKAIKRELSKITDDKFSVILKPRGFIKYFWRDYSLTIEILPFWKKIILFLIVSLLYLIAFPIIFFYGLVKEIMGYKNAKRYKDELRNTYTVDYTVSEIKTFSQLFDDKGLRNWGISHMHLTGFTEEEQLDCIFRWFCILYDKKEKHFDKLIKQIREDSRKLIVEFHKRNPEGHISPISIAQALPIKIDEEYGNYE